MENLSKKSIEQLISSYYGAEFERINTRSYHKSISRIVIDRDIISHSLLYSNSKIKMNHQTNEFLKTLENFNNLLNNVNSGDNLKTKENIKNVEAEYRKSHIKFVCFKNILDFKKEISPINYFNGTYERLEPWREFAEANEVDISSYIKNIYNHINNYSSIYEGKSPVFISNQITTIERLLSSYDHLDYYPDEEKTEEINRVKESFDEFHLAIKNSVSGGFYDFIAFKDLQETIKLINMEMYSIYNKIKNTTNEQYLTSECIIELGKKNDEPISFLNNKEKKEEILKNSVSYIIDIPVGQYRSFTMFDDSSVLLTDKNGEMHAPAFKSELKLFVDTILKNHMEFLLRKNPTIYKSYVNTIDNNYCKFNEVILTINTYLDNESILKASGYNLSEKLKTSFNFESLDDEMNATIFEHKFKQYAHSIASNKYRHLYNEETYEVLKEIYLLNVEQPLLQSIIGKKIAAFKTPDDFNDSLGKLLNSFNNFTPEDILKKANSLNANIISTANNKTIVQITDYNQSEQLGSSSWCIVRNKHYFDSYTEDGNKQYFIFDFNKSSSDNESMIGVTLDKNGSITTSHLKNDDYYDNCRVKLKNVIDLILDKQSELYPSKSNKIKNSM